MKYFIISIDTEGDNLWVNNALNPSTNNAKYLPRFQDLCEKYGYIPTYFVNYEMIKDDYFVDYFKEKAINGKCEIGMHLHAWNSPPFGENDEANCKIRHSYLTEYSPEMMRKKIETLTDLIEDKIGIRPTSHRAGRWIINKQYISILGDNGYIVDSSITPHINWRKENHDDLALDYSGYNPHPSYDLDSTRRVIEVPMTIKFLHRFKSKRSIGVIKSFARGVKLLFKGSDYWLRFIGNNRKMVDIVLQKAIEGNDEYIMLMLHSSELMPNGSPYFRSGQDIEELYQNFEWLFNKVHGQFVGISLSDYAKIAKGEI